MSHRNWTFLRKTEVIYILIAAQGGVGEQGGQIVC